MHYTQTGQPQTQRVRSGAVTEKERKKNPSNWLNNGRSHIAQNPHYHRTSHNVVHYTWWYSRLPYNRTHRQTFSLSCIQRPISVYLCVCVWCVTATAVCVLFTKCQWRVLDCHTLACLCASRIVVHRHTFACVCVCVHENCAEPIHATVDWTDVCGRA